MTADLDIVWRSDSRYAALLAGLCWNERLPDRFPDGICRARSVPEVAGAVTFARRRGLRVSARSGGHNYGSLAVRAGGLLLDVSGLDGIVVDPSGDGASVGPGATGQRLVAALGEVGRTFPAGHCPGVGLGGYLLGGGAGWNYGSLGAACASVRGIQLVDADGEVVEAGAGHHEDLLWAARGGGAAFPGIVTRFDLQTYPRPRYIACAEWGFALHLIDEVAQWSAAAAESMPAAVELYFYACPGRPAALPDAGAGPTILVRAIAFAEDERQARAMTAPLAGMPVARLATIVHDLQPATMAQLFSSSAAMHPDHRRNAMDQLWLAGWPPGGLAAVAAHIARAPSPESSALFFPTPHRPDHPAAGDDLAFSVADSVYVLLSAAWRDPADDAANVTWFEELVAMLEPSATGFYANETNLFESPGRASRCFSAERWTRLQEIKHRHDPDNVFFNYPFVDAGE